MTDEPALVCRGIAKRFGSQMALSHGELEVRAGSIHALVGENGAGKSTLINIVSGLIVPDSGSVEVFGEKVRFGSPLDAVAAGIGVVHQHFLLTEAFTVAENVALGIRQSPGGWHFDRKRAEAEVAALSEQTGLPVDPRARVADLPVGMRQRVEILKALSRGARILLLDEPTAVLAPPEVGRLFETLRKMSASGRTLVIITHKLDEVFALASAATVLRAGKTVFTGKLSELSPGDLARKMIGQAAPLVAQAGSPPAPDTKDSSEIVLEIGGIDIPRVLQIDALQVHAGEIVGIAGVEGNGQQELADILTGMRAPEHANLESAGGRTVLRLHGVDLLPLSVRERNEAGIAYIPSDRHREGLVLEMTLAENIFLRRPIFRRIPGVALLDHSEMTAQAESSLRDFNVNPPRPELSARVLSGGNQQKVVAAREFSHAPKLILACNPTRGLDVGAAADVQNRLLAAAKKSGAGVLLISSDLDEIMLLSDRVNVLYRGRLTNAGVRGVGKEEVGRAMVGAGSEKAMSQS